MFIKSLMKSSVVFSLIFFLYGMPLMGQQQNNPQKEPGSPGSYKKENSKKEKIPYSDAKLQKFAKVMQVSQKINMKGKQKMSQKIEESQLDKKTFQQIKAKKQQKGKFPDNTSKAEKKAYKKLNKKIRKIEREYQNKMEKAIKENGLKKKEFMEMSRAMQRNKAMYKKVQQMSKN